MHPLHTGRGVRTAVELIYLGISDLSELHERILPEDPACTLQNTNIRYAEIAWQLYEQTP